MNVHVPANVTADLFTVDYRGYVQLPAGVSGTQSATYFVGGTDPVADDGSSFTGPVSKDYLTHDTFVASFGCGSDRVVPININSQVRLTGAPNVSAQITTDSIDGKLSTTPQPCAPAKDDCKKGGWQNFVSAPGPFKNQGDCVSYFASGGKNQGNGN